MGLINTEINSVSNKNRLITINAFSEDNNFQRETNHTCIFSEANEVEGRNACVVYNGIEPQGFREYNDNVNEITSLAPFVCYNNTFNSNVNTKVQTQFGTTTSHPIHNRETINGDRNATTLTQIRNKDIEDNKRDEQEMTMYNVLNMLP